MYLGIANFVHKRKVARCRKGGCGRDIEKGEPAITLVRKGKKESRSYRWFHPQCFLEWAEHLYERREKYRIENPPVRSGRPAVGTPVSDLLAEDPDAAKERARLMRRRARLVRQLVEQEDERQQLVLVLGIDEMEERIKEILPLQIDAPGKRSPRNRDIGETKYIVAQIKLRRMTEDEKESLRNFYWL